MTNSAPPFRLTWDDAMGIGRCVWSPESGCRLEDAEAITAGVIGLGRGMVPLLVSGLSKLDRPAREYLLRDEGNVSAVALLADTAVSRMIANFFIGVGRPVVPVRLFTEEQAAIEWLRDQQ